MIPSAPGAANLLFLDWLLSMSITPARSRCCAVFVLLVAEWLGLNASGWAAEERLGGRTNANVPPQVEAIDTWIRQGWQASGVRPAPAAEDGEYCRRVFLDLIGRVPTVTELRQYEGDRSPQKQRRLVQRLLNDEAYRAERVRYWAVLWTNLLIGRAGGESREGFVSRAGMAAYLEEAFAENRPYDRMVYELIAATGANRPDAPGFNGAVNFLTGKLEDRATQATAQTARLFLGLQVQCTQCHNHPFNDWKQSQFWGLSSFFRQAVVLRRFEPGARDLRFVELADQDFAGEDRPREPETARVYYELRNGKLEAAFPVFVDGTEISHSGYLEEVNRREQLARLVTQSEYLPQALVNRLWAHFLGYGFTKPVDDLGPHNPPTHPELFAYLAEQFKQHSFDLKQLMEWIVLSEPYGRSSRIQRQNEEDDPTRGQPPRFSHFYVRQMTAEQLYSSLLVASRADSLQGDADQQARAREQWLRQFTLVLGTDEGDDATTFDGTITQTLMMFNGSLMKQATSLDQGSFLASVLSDSRLRPVQKVQELFLAAFARRPTSRELRMAQQLLASAPDDATVWQDFWWALLNSNEFLLIR